MHRERSVIESEWALIAENIERHQVATVQGSARFVDARTLEVMRHGMEPRRLSAEYFLVAAGARPEPPRGFALDDEVVVDSESLLTIQRIPSSMIVIGGGVVGCEYACIFAALGVRVTLVNERGRLRSHLDPDVGGALRQSMTGRLNVTVHGNAEIRSMEVEGRRAQAGAARSSLPALRRASLVGMTLLLPSALRTIRRAATAGMIAAPIPSGPRARSRARPRSPTATTRSPSARAGDDRLHVRGRDHGSGAAPAWRAGLFSSADGWADPARGLVYVFMIQRADLRPNPDDSAMRRAYQAAVASALKTAAAPVDFHSHTVLRQRVRR